MYDWLSVNNSRASCVNTNENDMCQCDKKSSLTVFRLWHFWCMDIEWDKMLCIAWDFDTLLKKKCLDALNPTSPPCSSILSSHPHVEYPDSPVGGILPLPSPFPSHSLPFFPLPYPFPSLHLEINPLNTARRPGEGCTLPRQVWGGAPSGNWIQCILALKSDVWWHQFYLFS